MTSVLFKNGKGEKTLAEEDVADLFADLNLDQIITGTLSGKSERALEDLFRTPLSDAESIAYRQAVVRDLENKNVSASVTRFSRKIAESIRFMNLERELRYKDHKDGWFLEAALSYIDAVSTLSVEFSDAELNSEGMLKWRKWLTGYADGDEFKRLAMRAEAVKQNLSDAKYTVRIKENSCTVRKFAGELNHESEIVRTFAKFQEGAVKNYLSESKVKSSGMNHVKGRILECVAKLYPECFKALHEFRSEFADFKDERVLQFDVESRFLTVYLEYIEPMRKKGLNFCYPEMTTLKGEINAKNVFDLALARKLLNAKADIVLNDFSLRGVERVLVVSGPNQGGKTTFARTFGQTHFLAKLGFPVPGTHARLFLCDRIFTHFEREEEIANLRGKLQDDLTRIYDALTQATENSIIILNEIFNSTTLKDGVFLGERILERISEIDAVCMLVTFMEELSSDRSEDRKSSGKIVSLVSAVRPDNPADRTYKIVRKTADGRAYAKVMAEKHHLTYVEVKERLEHNLNTESP